MVLLSLAVLLAGGIGAEEEQTHDHSGHVAETEARYSKSSGAWEAPPVVLVDQDGEKVALVDALTPTDGPVVLQFIFTTCPAVCPMLTGTLAAARRELGAEIEGMRLVSISVDPEHDTPERLREYAALFMPGEAGEDWRFLTGELDDVIAAQKAFDAYRGNKMRHPPLTFLRAPGDELWVRLDGFPSAAELAAEIRLLGDPALGERIYREGLLPSGQPIQGTEFDNLALVRAHFSCAACHRRSGQGSFEGGVYVPPITGPFLFEERPERRVDHFRRLYQEMQPRLLYSEARIPRTRPPYTATTLETALREGRDPTGRPLHPLMPRYDLEAADLAHLVAYLETLGRAPDPGVDETTLHFATVTTPEVEPTGRDALLEVLDAYVRFKNTATQNRLARPGASPWHRDDFLPSYRLWSYEEWRLEGPPESWGAQLEARYRERPVFALLSGLGQDEWRPVHAFCERLEVPCLFPNLTLPVMESGDWALYFSRGPILEAEALAAHLRPAAGPDFAVRQVYDGQAGAAAARAFAAALGETPESAPRALAPDALVLWLEKPDFKNLEIPETISRVYLSSTLLGETFPSEALARLDPDLRQRLRVVHPFALPGRSSPRVFRVRAWLRSRGLGRDHERLRLSTYFALSVTDHALHHIVDHYSRAYLVEAVEHETENALEPGVYPRLSLGPGQRFASKGAHIVAVAADGGLESEGTWIVP